MLVPSFSKELTDRINYNSLAVGKRERAVGFVLCQAITPNKMLGSCSTPALPVWDADAGRPVHQQECQSGQPTALFRNSCLNKRGKEKGLLLGGYHPSHPNWLLHDSLLLIFPLLCHAAALTALIKLSFTSPFLWLDDKRVWLYDCCGLTSASS